MRAGIASVFPGEPPSLAPSRDCELFPGGSPRASPLRLREQVRCLAAAELVREVRRDDAVRVVLLRRLGIHLAAARLAVEVREDRVDIRAVAGERVGLRI